MTTLHIEGDAASLLRELAREHDETPEALLLRLIQKEHFERHAEWNALMGTSTSKTCISRLCFMQLKQGGPTP